PASVGESPVPTTGVFIPELEGFDEVMRRIVTRWEIPGAQLAVAKDGQLKLNHGYGYADFELAQVVQLESRFRIASVTKPITGVAILKLIQDGKLKLDDKAFVILDNLKAPAGAEEDPRLNEITIQNLLQHTGGWDSSRSFDPQYPPFSLS